MPDTYDMALLHTHKHPPCGLSLVLISGVCELTHVPTRSLAPSFFLTLSNTEISVCTSQADLCKSLLSKSKKKKHYWRCGSCSRSQRRPLSGFDSVRTRCELIHCSVLCLSVFCCRYLTFSFLIICIGPSSLTLSQFLSFSVLDVLCDAGERLRVIGVTAHCIHTNVMYSNEHTSYCRSF